MVGSDSLPVLLILSQHSSITLFTQIWAKSIEICWQGPYGRGCMEISEGQSAMQLKSEYTIVSELSLTAMQKQILVIKTAYTHPTL